MVVPWGATRYEKTPEGNLIVYIFGEVKNDTSTSYTTIQVYHT